MTHATTEEFLAHYGVPGMKWGKRNNKSANKEPASSDAKKTAELIGRKKTSGTSALSNKELQTVIQRKQLEQQYAQLNPGKIAQGNNKAKTILGVVGTVSAVVALGSSPLGKIVKTGVTNAIKRA